MSCENPNSTYSVLQGTRQTPVLASIAQIQQNEKRYESQLNRRLNEFEGDSLHMINWGSTMTYQGFM